MFCFVLFTNFEHCTLYMNRQGHRKEWSLIVTVYCTNFPGTTREDRDIPSDIRSKYRKA
jgi:hypothetical protein